jgi:hypothetical protein
MNTHTRFLVTYLFHGQSRHCDVDVDDATLTAADATLHVLQLHFGDAEAGLMMPPADATAEQIVEQAKLLGISSVYPRALG